MPEGGGTQYVNRIGLGVEVDDPGGASLRHLAQVRSEIRAILELSRRMASTRLPAGSPGAGGASSRQQRKAEVEEQGRLFSDGVARQRTLFTRSEIEQTRIHTQQARKRTLNSDEEYQRDVENFTRAERRKANIARHQFGQRLSSTPERERARAEGEVEAEALTRARRRAINERINRRAKEIQYGVGGGPPEPSSAEAAAARLERRRRERDIMRHVSGREQASQLDVTEHAEAQLSREKMRRLVRERAEQLKGLHYTSPIGPRPEEVDLDAARQMNAERRRRIRQALRANEPLEGPDVPYARQILGRTQRREESRRAEAEAERRRVEEERRAHERRVQKARRDTEAAREQARLDAERAAEERRVYRTVRTPEGRDQLDRMRREAARPLRPPQLVDFAARQQQGVDAALTRTSKAVNKASDDLRRFQSEAQRISFRRPRTEVGADAEVLSRRLAGLQQIARHLREEIGKPASMRRTREEIDRDMARISARTRQAENELRRLREEEQKLPPTAKGDPQSTGGVIQRVIRNMAIRAAIFYSIYNLKKFTQDSVEAARVAAQTERQLEATARQAGVAVSETLSIGEAIRSNADLSRREAQGVVANVARFAARANTRGQVGEFSKAVADLAAARGIENKELANTVDRLFRGEGVEEVLGREPQTLFRQYAQRRLEAQQLPSSLWVGAERPDTRAMSQRISEYVSALTDAQRAQIIWNETLRAGNEFVGEAARRHSTLEGRLDTARGRWEDAHVAVGNFVLQLRPLNDLLGFISEKLNGLDTDKLRFLGSGPNGLITPQDVAAYTSARSEAASTRANTLYSSYGGAAEVVGGIAGVGYLAGRAVARPAIEGGKVTITQTVRAGLTRIFVGMRNGIARVASAAGYEAESTALAGVGAGGALAAGVTAAVGLLIVGVTSQLRREAEAALARAEVYAVAEGARTGQLNAARKAGTLRYFVGRGLEDRGAGALGPEAQGISEAEFFRRYTPEKRAELFRQNRVQQFVTEAPKTEAQLALEERANRAGMPGTTDVETVEKAERVRSDFWADVTKREEEERQKSVELQGRALSTLRETAEGSFRIVEEVAQQRVVDNPYVKIFTDAVTAADRMHQQWKFLGQETEKYFTSLEMGRIQLQRISQDFATLAQTQELFGKAAHERAEYDLSPDLTREEQAYEGLARSALEAAQNIPKLEAMRRALLQGVAPDRFDRERTLRAQLEDFTNIRNVYGLGLDEQGQRAIRRATSEATVNAIQASGLSGRQIRRTPFLREAYREALDDQIAEQRAAIQDSANRLRLVQLERERAVSDVGEASELRRAREQDIYGRASTEGRGTFFEGRFVGNLNREERAQLRRIGQVSDAALIRITDKFGPRELGADLFQVRNDAIRREAERQTAQFEESLAAAQEAVEVQRRILALLESNRESVLSGNLRLAIEVTNETSARIDQEALREANEGFKPAGLGSVSAPNAYTPAFARYARGGKK